MPVTYPDTRVLPTAQQLLACLSTQVLMNPKPPSIVGFRTGTQGQALSATNEDECCQGAAFVRVLRTYPSWSVPTPAAMSVRCAQPQAVEFELSMWRCSPIGTLETLPTQAEWDEINTDLLNDRATLMAAACCFIGLRDPGSVMYGEWQPVPSDGGCVGSTFTIQADLYGRTV